MKYTNKEIPSPTTALILIVSRWACSPIHTLRMSNMSVSYLCGEDALRYSGNLLERITQKLRPFSSYWQQQQLLTFRSHCAENFFGNHKSKFFGIRFGWRPQSYETLYNFPSNYFLLLQVNTPLFKKLFPTPIQFCNLLLDELPRFYDR